MCLLQSMRSIMNSTKHRVLALLPPYLFLMCAAVSSAVRACVLSRVFSFPGAAATSRPLRADTPRYSDIPIKHAKPRGKKGKKGPADALESTSTDSLPSASSHDDEAGENKALLEIFRMTDTVSAAAAAAAAAAADTSRDLAGNFLAARRVPAS